MVRNKTRTSKVGAISKAQKVSKIVKGDPLGFLKIQFVAKYQKLKGHPLKTLKKLKGK